MKCFIAIALLAVAVSASPVEYGHYGPALVHSAPLVHAAPVLKHVVAEPVVSMLRQLRVPWASRDPSIVVVLNDELTSWCALFVLFFAIVCPRPTRNTRSTTASRTRIPETSSRRLRSATVTSSRDSTRWSNPTARCAPSTTPPMTTTDSTPSSTSPPRPSRRSSPPRSPTTPTLRS
uniref:Secreted protein n=1 Tax=Anopheles atroparvus TaxID=41427 RepID=A0AAG5DG11_ANOAO